MHDHHALHRDFLSGEIVGKPHPTSWDYVLADAFQMIEDNTDSHGNIAWEVGHDNVTVDAIKRIDKAQAAIDRKTKGSEKKPYKPLDGETWITRPRLKNKSAGWPTPKDYYEQEIKKNPPED